MFVLDSGPSVTDWVGAIAAALTFFVAGIALAFAWGQIKEAEKTRQQVADIERDKSQPMVVAFMEPGVSRWVIELVVRNYGQTPAYDVRFTSDPLIRRVKDNNDSSFEDVKIPEVIPFLAPGQEWRTIWDVAHNRPADGKLPDKHNVVVTFKGIDGKQLESKAILDWAILRDSQFIVAKTLHDAAKSLDEIAKQFKKSTDIHGGFKVWTRSGDEKDRRLKEAHERLQSMNDREKDGLKESFSDNHSQPAGNESDALDQK